MSIEFYILGTVVSMKNDRPNGVIHQS